ncbi:hypothetical protein J2Z79_001951 [Symbiobacterium terraclitae]|uniref:FtsK domain-containing protein n=1 Tax=Symbiobacterium terraclitae TaxID=557451 RepID=A0ABS4JSM3_9FIRM|nr:FtsK/SpoIIIE domain-containing protein [Symbiobacterium terraclitae]MBP2018536.1 hypothetical protein [Symbiobacterium terraclitae]
MNLDRNVQVAGVLTDQLRNAKIGVVVKGVHGIDPAAVAAMVSTTIDDLHVSAVGYPLGTSIPENVRISTKLEDAVQWRSTPELAGRIVVFVKDDAPKLHSLGDLDVITERDIAAYILDQAQADPSNNDPQVRFWKALRDESDTFPLELLEQFVSAVQQDAANVNAIVDNLWRLGLLRDEQLLDRRRDPRERLVRNRELLVEMALLSEQSRKRLGNVLVGASGDERERLRRAFADLKVFYTTRDKQALRRLDVETVEALIKAGRPLPKKNRRVPTPDRLVDDNGGRDTEQSVPLKGKRLVQAIAECVTQGTEDAQKGLQELVAAIRRRIANPQDGEATVAITPGFGGRTVVLDLPNGDLSALIVGACSDGRWGGVLETTRTTLKDALLHASLTDLKPYSPMDPEQGLLGKCLFTLLRSFDRYTNGTDFSEAIDRMTDARERLAGNADILLSYPFALLGGDQDARRALNEYLDAYESLLRSIRQYEALLHERDAEALRYVLTELLRLDVIYVRTPGEWKALLTPLHPFHLWRYREILREVNGEGRELTDDERETLAEVLPSLPHLVHYLVVTPQVAGEQPIVLPQAGTIETLPTFENHTNRYLGSDGIDFLPEVLKRYVTTNPFASPQLRLGLVDVPDVKLALTAIADFYRSGKCRQVLVEVYFTRGQNPRADLGRLDLDDRDHELAELLRRGQIVTQMHSVPNVDEAVNRLAQHPVHLAVLFDQAQYHIGHAPKARRLLVSPLVVTYRYEFSETFQKGTISPSSEADEGIFADYHFVIERAALLPAGQQLRLQYDQSADLRSVNSLLSSGAASWMVIADRDLTPYSPESAVPLGERRIGQREVGVWAPPSTRTIGHLVDLLRRFNLRPDVQTVATLVQRFGHIAAGGLLSLPGPGGHPEVRERQEKAFMGTVLAAAWYRTRYPISLVASLDSNLARLWLSSRHNTSQRADLIGLRVDDDGGIVVEPIEVKTHADNAEVRVERVEGGLALAGHAIEQLRATIEVLESIFGDEDSQTLFTPARRETLKYQLFRECFRDVHDPEWKREWYRRLQGTFARPSTLPVRCAGVVVHVQPEENTSRPEVQDAVHPLRLVTLGTQEVQSLVSDAHPRIEFRLAEETDTSQIAAEDVPIRDADDNPVEEDQPSIPGVDTTSSVRSTSPFEQGEGVVSKTEEIQDLVRSFRRACQSYRVQIADCDPEQAVVGPSVIRLYVRLARGQRLDPLRDVLPDIGREMRRTGLLVSQVPQSDLIALDVPRIDRVRVPLSQGLRAMPRISKPEEMPIPIGVTPEGQDVIRDLGRMPHMLVGGTTGAGKTRFLYGVLLGLLTTHPEADSLRLFLSSSKPEDFSFFEGIPHLEGGRVIYDADEAIELLSSQVTQTLDARGEFLMEAHCVNIQDYNRKNPQQPMAPLVVVVDEFADLVDQLGRQRNARDAFYKNIRRVAQLGRSRGIHLVLCTQRPSADLVPTNIRNLMNARVALRVNDVTASRMILEAPGAEQLQFHGDLLFKEPEGVIRAQGYTIEPEELVSILSGLRC